MEGFQGMEKRYAARIGRKGMRGKGCPLPNKNALDPPMLPPDTFLGFKIY